MYHGRKKRLAGGFLPKCFIKKFPRRAAERTDFRGERRLVLIEHWPRNGRMILAGPFKARNLESNLCPSRQRRLIQASLTRLRLRTEPAFQGRPEFSSRYAASFRIRDLFFVCFGSGVFQQNPNPNGHRLPACRQPWPLPARDLRLRRPGKTRARRLTSWPPQEICPGPVWV